MSQRFILHTDESRNVVLANLDTFLRRLPADKKWAVTIERYVKPRSNEQNAYLHGVAYKLLSDATGYTMPDIAEYLLGEYFGWVERRIPGHLTARSPRRTTTTDEDGKRAVLSTVEFADYVAFVQQFGAEHGIYIPDPDPFHDEPSR